MLGKIEGRRRKRLKRMGCLHGISDSMDMSLSNLRELVMECEVKWALESITTNKAGGGDGIPVELYQILKDDA